MNAFSALREAQTLSLDPEAVRAVVVALLPELAPVLPVGDVAQLDLDRRGAVANWCAAALMRISNPLHHVSFNYAPLPVELQGWYRRMAYSGLTVTSTIGGRS